MVRRLVFLSGPGLFSGAFWLVSGSDKCQWITGPLRQNRSSFSLMANLNPTLSANNSDKVEIFGWQKKKSHKWICQIDFLLEKGLISPLNCHVGTSPNVRGLTWLPKNVGAAATRSAARRPRRAWDEPLDNPSIQGGPQIPLVGWVVGWGMKFTIPRFCRENKKKSMK